MALAMGSGLRWKVDYRYNNFSGTSGQTTSGGLEQKFGTMFNVLYDFVGNHSHMCSRMSVLAPVISGRKRVIFTLRDLDWQPLQKPAPKAALPIKVL